VEEDLRSPCTQEIAVFRAFAQIVEKAENEVVVIDTAPTGHTLLLLDSTQSYHREVQRTQGDIPEPVKKLLPRPIWSWDSWISKLAPRFHRQRVK
jgi:arsenite-transporting ATPase